MEGSRISTQDTRDLSHRLGSDQKVYNYSFNEVNILFPSSGLESFMMINKAYKIMENINDIVSHDDLGQELPNEKELKVTKR